MKSRTIAAIAVALCLSTLAHAQNATATLLPAAGLQADVAILRRAYTELHPGLYRYNTSAQIDDAFRALGDEFQTDRTLDDAYLAFSSFAAKLKCGHTYANFYNQSRRVQDALFKAGRLPIYFRWIDGRMIVTRSFTSDPRVVPGTEVLTINGTPVAEIRQRLLSVARADGSNDAKRLADMEVQGRDRFEAFDIFFPLFFPSNAPQMQLKLHSPTHRRAFEIDVLPLTYEQRLSAMVDSEGKPDAPAFEFRPLDERTAYLRMPTWALYDSKWDWKKFLDESFDALSKGRQTDLVIDIRDNEGGLDVGDVIVSHLIAAPVSIPPYKRLVRYRKIPADLSPLLDTWDDSFRDWGSDAVEGDNGFYELKSGDDGRPEIIQPAQPRFSGRVWVLVGPVNSSATFQFADLVQRNGIAKLVGQATGGNRRGINGGAFFFLKLPNSGLELDVPLIGLFPSAPQADEGLRPDIPVIPTITDIARAGDAEVDAVRAQMRRASQAPN